MRKLQLPIPSSSDHLIPIPYHMVACRANVLQEQHVAALDALQQVQEMRRGRAGIVVRGVRSALANIRCLLPARAASVALMPGFVSLRRSS